MLSCLRLLLLEAHINLAQSAKTLGEIRGHHPHPHVRKHIYKGGSQVKEAVKENNLLKKKTLLDSEESLASH